MVGVQNAGILIVFLMLVTKYTAKAPFLMPALRISLVPFPYSDLETVLEFINTFVNRGRKYTCYCL